MGALGRVVVRVGVKGLSLKLRIIKKKLMTLTQSILKSRAQYCFSFYHPQPHADCRSVVTAIMEDDTTVLLENRARFCSN